MNSILVFSTGIGITASISLLVIVYLKGHLKNILTELCGTEDRALFWLSFTNLTLLLTPIFFAMNYYPKAIEGTPVFFEITTQVKWGLVGLMVTVVIMGAVIKSYIPSARSVPHGNAANKGETAQT